MRRSRYLDRTVWRPQKQFVASIASLRQLNAFNDKGGIAVNFGIAGSVRPQIKVVGSQSETLSFWETQSASGFVTKPKFNDELITIRFITAGHIVYCRRQGEFLGSPTHATLASFEDLSEVRASRGLSAVSGTIAIQTLEAAYKVLTRSEKDSLPQFEPVAAMSTHGMRALFCTVSQVHRRIQDLNCDADLVLPLVQEIVSYQILSSWPQYGDAALPHAQDASLRSLGVAIDYIQANLSRPLTLADIATASSISVRSLQNKFRKEIGLTPVQYIIDQRLSRAHQDLLSPGASNLSVADIARRWGFVHISDFGQRYRRLYGRTPSITRREARNAGNEN